MEKAVASQLQSFLFQSCFRPQHSTETAIWKVDLLLTGDSCSFSILLLLNLSSLFDTVCHKILLSRLAEFGISGSALSWLSSYLTGRQYHICLHNSKSPTILVKRGVPQGSVLGPLLFILYIQPLGNIIRRHGFSYHSYADDIQLYIDIAPPSYFWPFHLLCTFTFTTVFKLWSPMYS